SFPGVRWWAGRGRPPGASAGPGGSWWTRDPSRVVSILRPDVRGHRDAEGQGGIVWIVPPLCRGRRHPQVRDREKAGKVLQTTNELHDGRKAPPDFKLNRKPVVRRGFGLPRLGCSAHGRTASRAGRGGHGSRRRLQRARLERGHGHSCPAAQFIELEQQPWDLAG